MKTTYTISIFTDDRVGMLHRVTSCFTRRKVNIESLTTSVSEVEGIHRYTILVEMELESEVKKLANALEKQVEVHKVFYHTEDDIVYQEIALYKVPTEAIVQGDAEHIMRAHHARILTVEPTFTVFEKTGHRAETQALFEALEPYGILEFVRSGRVAIMKPTRRLSEYMEELALAAAN